MKWKSSEQDEGNWCQEQAGEKRVKAEEPGLVFALFRKETVEADKWLT